MTKGIAIVEVDGDFNPEGFTASSGVENVKTEETSAPADDESKSAPVAQMMKDVPAKMGEQVLEVTAKMSEVNIQQTETSEERIRKQLLKEGIEKLGILKLQKVLNINDAVVVMKLAELYNFTTDQKLTLKSQQMGGGSPNVKFVDTLVYAGKYIEDIKEAFENIEIEKASDIFEDILKTRGLEEFGDMKFDELAPHEISQFYPILIEDPENENKICWLNLAEELNMAEIRQRIKATMKQGYIFSITEGLINQLKAKRTTVEDFQGKLKQIEEKGQLSIGDVTETFNDLVESIIEKKVTQEKRDADRKKREEEKKNKKKVEKSLR